MVNLRFILDMTDSFFGLAHSEQIVYLNSITEIFSGSRGDAVHWGDTQRNKRHYLRSSASSGRFKLGRFTSDRLTTGRFT